MQRLLDSPDLMEALEFSRYRTSAADGIGVLNL